MVTVRRKTRICSPLRQKGATLVIALLILVLIMMIGITAVSTSNTQYKLAGNLQFEDGAMNNAETAVSTAENWLAAGTNIMNSGFSTYSSGTPHLYPIGSAATIIFSPLTTTWDDSNSLCVGSSDIACTGGNTNQRYVIQEMSANVSLMGSGQVVGGRRSTACNTVNTYQIIGRGLSPRGANKTVVSYFSVFSC
jgi:type IV pilus assembly protein PilX